MSLRRRGKQSEGLELSGDAQGWPVWQWASPWGGGGAFKCALFERKIQRMNQILRENEWNGRDGRNADSPKENWSELDKPTKIKKNKNNAKK